LAGVTTIHPPGIDAAFAAIDHAQERICEDLAAMLAVGTSFPAGAGYAAFADLTGAGRGGSRSRPLLYCPSSVLPARGTGITVSCAQRTSFR
jgi:hypothetical protein